jgi:hypothetical protein
MGDFVWMIAAYLEIYTTLFDDTLRDLLMRKNFIFGLGKSGFEGCPFRLGTI